MSRRSGNWTSHYIVVVVIGHYGVWVNVDGVDDVIGGQMGRGFGIRVGVVGKVDV